MRPVPRKTIKGTRRTAEQLTRYMIDKWLHPKIRKSPKFQTYPRSLSKGRIKATRGQEKAWPAAPRSRDVGHMTMPSVTLSTQPQSRSCGTHLFTPMGAVMAGGRSTVGEQLALTACCEKCGGYAFLARCAPDAFKRNVPRSGPTSAWTANTRCNDPCRVGSLSDRPPCVSD